MKFVSRPVEYAPELHTVGRNRLGQVHTLRVSTKAITVDTATHDEIELGYCPLLAGMMQAKMTAKLNATKHIAHSYGVLKFRSAQVSLTHTCQKYQSTKSLKFPKATKNT